MNIDCNNLHQYIKSGVCPGCNEVFSQSAHDKSDGAIKWDIDRLESVLDTTSGEALSGLLARLHCLSPDIDQMKCVYAKALNHSDQHVRYLVERMLLDTGAKWHQSADYWEHMIRTPEFALLARIVLLGFYCFRAESYSELLPRSVEHSLWIIENVPDRDLISYCLIDAGSNPVAYARGSTLWKDRLSKPHCPTQIIVNAATYFREHEPDLSQQLFSSLQSNDSDNPQVTRRMIESRLCQIRRSPTSLSTQAESLVTELRALFSLTSDQHEKIEINLLLINIRIATDQVESAHSLASKMLAMCENTNQFKHRSHTLHRTYIALGRIALRNGDRPHAMQYLELAGESVSGNSAETFRPDMKLAEELLAYHEHCAVITFIQQCRQSWNDENHMADQWIESIKAGAIPQFNNHAI